MICYMIVFHDLGGCFEVEASGYGWVNGYGTHYLICVCFCSFRVCFTITLVGLSCDVLTVHLSATESVAV